MDKKELDFKAIVKKQLYNSENYKIYTADINNKVYPNIISTNNSITLVGNTPNLIPNIEYEIKAIIQNNKKYGISYVVKSIRRDKPTDYSSSKSFLNEVLNENQSAILLEAYPDIIDRIIKNNLDDIDLSKTKGIKEATFAKIKTKVIENFCLIELVDIFGGN